MNLLLRFVWVYFISKFAPTVGVLDEASINFRVLPTDIDFYLHMNNGRYLSIMDLGRLNYLMRSKLFPLLKKGRIYPVIASEMIRFKKSLNLFQKYELSTKLIGWDDKFIYMVQHFKSNNEVCALAIIKACFLRIGGGRITASELLQLLGMEHHPTLVLPQWIQDWVRADQHFHDDTIKEND